MKYLYQFNIEGCDAFWVVAYNLGEALERMKTEIEWKDHGFTKMPNQIDSVHTFTFDTVLGQERFEKFDPDWVTPTGYTIKDVMEELGMDSTELANRLKLDLNTVEKILNGDQYLTPCIAQGLSSLTGTSPTFWLRRDANYQGGLLEGKKRL